MDSKHRWGLFLICCCCFLTWAVTLVAEVCRSTIVLSIALEQSRNALSVVALEEAGAAAVLNRYNKIIQKHVYQRNHNNEIKLHMRYDVMHLRQKCSSEKSRQSGQPSHFSDMGMHCFMLWHMKSSGGHVKSEKEWSRTICAIVLQQINHEDWVERLHTAVLFVNSVQAVDHTITREVVV